MSYPAEKRIDRFGQFIGVLRACIEKAGRGEKRIDRLGQLIDNGNGTVTDTHTGLMWMREREASKVSFPDAMKIRKDFAGYKDWRLPTIYELKTIATSDYLRYFEKPVAGYYWSCTNSYGSWYSIISSMGSIDKGNLTGIEYARLVRNNQRFPTSTKETYNKNATFNSDAVDYQSNTVVTFTENPLKKSEFKSLSGDSSGQDTIYMAKMNSAKTITTELTQLKYILNVKLIGAGNGIVEYSSKAEKYTFDSVITLTARAEADSIFIGWHGDASVFGNTCAVTMNSSKNIFAEFSRFESLEVNLIGSGSGFIRRSPEAADKYLHGSSITLNAQASEYSKFKCWDGDATGNDTVCTVTMDSAKTIFAEFTEIELFTLDCTKEGSGNGSVTWELKSGLGKNTPEGSYFDGSVISLIAHASEGSKFKCWHGDASGSNHVCTITFDSAKIVIAEFEELEFFALNVKMSGSGNGVVIRSPEESSYLDGTTVTLTALPSIESLFNGWKGDAVDAGLDSSCTIAMNSKKSVTAEFIKLDITDLGIDVHFDTAEDANMKNGENAFILYFSIFNNGEKPVRVELPLASYVTSHGEEIEQSVWLSNLLLGNKGSTLRPGTFRKMGLVFYKSMLPKITIGDHLHVIIFQAKPAQRLNFTFRCTAKKPYKFILINSLAEDTLALDENGEISLEKLEILQRLTLLEDGMRDILRKLDTLQIPSTPIITSIQLKTTKTLSDVLAWLATKDRISIADLRGQLLPLDLLPSAIMDQLNERALDLTGELALEEINDDIVVSKEIFDEVLTNWNVNSS